MLSSWFKTTNIEHDKIKLKNFNINKNVRQSALIVGNRTVCQMLRNVNFLMQYKYENLITKIILYVNDAVLKLRKYKNDFDKNWWNNKTAINFNRSNFNEYYKELALEFMVIEHPVFTFYNQLYNININDDNIQRFILECIYYTYKINLKLLEYEYMDLPLSIAGNNYTQQWNNILTLLKNHNDNMAYDPYYITKWELRKRIQEKPYYIKKGRIANIKNDNDFKLAFDFSRKPVLDAINTNNYDAIIELGAGFGRNMYYYSSLIQDISSSIYIGEYTPGGIHTAKYIKNKYFSDKMINIFHFDYNNSDGFFENIKMKEKLSNVLITSFWSIEQITLLQPKLFDNILNMAEKVTCIHIEPIGWQVDPKSIMKENKTGFRSYYNKNLYSSLLNLQKQNKIVISNVVVDFFNFGDPESCGTLIEWHKT